MARPIRSRPPASATSPVAASGAFGTDLVASADSLRAFLALLRLLDEKGFLRFGSDLLREEDRVVEVLTQRLPASDVRGAMRAATALAAAFRDVDPAALASWTARVPRALAEAERAAAGPPIGPIEVLAALNDPDVNRGVRMTLGFLRGAGRSPGP